MVMERSRCELHKTDTCTLDGSEKNAKHSQGKSVNFIISKRELWLPEHRISWMSDRVIESLCDLSPWVSSATEAGKEMKFGTKVA